MTLFIKEEVEAAMDALKQVADFTEVWNIQDYLGDVAPDDSEGLAFQNCRSIKTDIDPEAPKIKVYTELKDELIPGNKLTGQVITRLISFLKQTQDLGNCLYDAISRGIQMKREVASILLR